MTPGPNRAPLERIGASQGQLRGLREELTDFRTVAEVYASEATTDHDRRYWERVAGHIERARVIVTDDIPEWLPGLPIGGGPKMGGGVDE